MNVIDFAAARARIESFAASVHEIEIAADRIPVVSPRKKPTLNELLRECIEFYGITATAQEIEK